jgi:DNA-binding NtrC family response regulator
MAQILIVEDHAGVAEVLCDALVEEGHGCSIAKHAGEARAMLAASRPDLVVTDILMPGGSGALVKQAANAVGVPALLITGDLAKIAQFEKEGISFLAKPFRIVEFIAAVATALQTPDDR